MHVNRSTIQFTNACVTVVEEDPETGVYYVGRGSYPNRDGVVQLDAALMRGRDCSFGAVAGLERLCTYRGLQLKCKGH